MAIAFPTDPAPTATPSSPLRIFARFLRFGIHAWGGPTAQIAMLRRELVEREQWIDEDRFRRALAVYQALPGPEAHELCCYFGMVAGGRVGSVAAGLGFMLPGLILMLAACVLYERFGFDAPLARAAFVGAQAAVIGIVIAAALRLTRSIVPRAGAASAAPIIAWLIALLGAIVQAIAAPFWIALLAGGIALAAAARRHTALAGVVLVVALGASVALRPQASPTPSQAAPIARTASHERLFATGLAGGLLSFGGAYTAIPVVRDASTGERGWTSERQFLDGLAIASILPAPLIIFATFVGYAGGGLLGALLMTLGVFLPAFGFTLIGHEFFERIVRHRAAHAFLDGVASAVCGVIATTSILLVIELGAGRTVGELPVPTWTPAALIAITVVAFFVTPRLRIRAAVPLLIGAAALTGAILFG